MKDNSERINQLIAFDKEFLKDYNLIAGIDEVGRGAIAGPVCAAAVVLNFNIPISEYIDDSKILTVKQREQAAHFIMKKSICFAYSFIENNIIDKINILQASLEAMQYAVTNLKIKPDLLLIDGNYYKNGTIPFRTIINGDAKSISIASASIIAKVHRDKFMKEIAHKMYPEYDFFSNKGYGTKKHYEAILKYGPCPIHRNTFLKKLYKRNETNLF